ncbi:sugar kinase [Nitriliruptor alkaliphilus]|uniref:sugar kinase n=1 Tax=Nitriliruptor alkaliphilus TaxID=427918 RepID=UPI000696235C|nr:sugar kinase [Nitriliruptor alkaliphilus]
MTTPTVIALGECMLELRQEDGATILGVGGDSYNTAVYLTREGAGRISVGYATVLGTDPYSDGILEAMTAEGLDVGLVQRVDDRHPGLYLVHVDPDGERHFLYYRGASAARRLLTTPRHQEVIRATAEADWIYLTGITLAVLEEAARERLLAAVQQARAAGGRVAFDTNYRPALWPDRGSARRCIAPFLEATDLALPSFEDERALWDAATPDDAVERLLAAGASEVVIKVGEKGVVLSDGATTRAVAAQPVDRPVDTTAAGDAFNGAYLAARIRGQDPGAAARHGVRLAARVVTARGAIVADAPGTGVQEVAVW